MRDRFLTLRVIYMLLVLVVSSISCIYAQTPFGTEITNTAHGSYSDAGGYRYNVSSEQTTTVVAPAYLLTISKSVDSPVYLPMDTVKYHIEISNTGNFIASSFSVSDTLPSELTYLSSNPPAQVNANVLTWDNLSLNFGNALQFDIFCMVPPGFSHDEEILNTAVYETAEKVKGISAPASILIGNKASLSIEKIVDKPSARPGETLNYNIRIFNMGNAPAYNVMLFDDLPQELVFVSASGDKQEQSGIVSWSVGDVHPGDIVERSVMVIVRDGVPAGTNIVNFASVSSGGEQKYTSAKVLVSESLGEPDLYMQRSMPSYASPLDTVTYQIFIENRGNAAATGLEMKETLHKNMEYISSSMSAIYDLYDNDITFHPDPLSAGKQDTVEVTVRIKKSVPDGSYLRSESDIVCFEGKAASAYSDILIESPILQISKTADSTKVQAGELVNYSIDYINSGHGIAKNVMVYDTLAAHVDFISASGTYHYYTHDHVIQWFLGDVDALMSSSQALNLSVRVHKPLVNGTELNNNAVMESDCGFSAEDTSLVEIVSAPGLSLVKSSVDEALVGDTIRYIFNYANQGNAVATSTVIVDTLSEHLKFISATGAYNYNSTYNTVMWNLGHLALNTQGSVKLDVKIKEDHIAVEEIKNKANIQSLGVVSESNTFITEIKPYKLDLTANPDSVIGNGEDYTQLTARVFDGAGRPVSDGTDVHFYTEHGTLLSTNHIVSTSNGYAEMRLRSEVVSTDYVPTKVSAEVVAVNGDRLTDSTDVVFYARRVNGVVRDNSGLPVSGAIVLLIQGGNIIGSAVTDESGNYSIALYHSGDYIIRVQFNDKKGDSHTIDQPVEVTDSGTGQVDDVKNTAALSGRIVDHMSGDPIRRSGVSIYLSHLSENTLNKYNDNPVYIDSVSTDTSGFFYFNKLDLGNYRIDAIFGKGEYFYAGTREVNLDQSGIHVINADIYNEPILFDVYKRVDKEIVVKGDSLRYTIYFQTLDNVIADTIHLVDQLPEEVEFIESSFVNGMGMRFDRYNPVSNEVSFLRYGMHAQQHDSITFLVEVTANIEKDITNTAYIYTENDTAYTADDLRTKATSSIIAPFLVVKKTVNKQIAELGDVLTYTVEVTNQSEDQGITNFLLTDKLPVGFRYREGRTIIGTETIADPEMLMQDNRATLLWHVDRSIAPGGSIKIKYRTVVGMNCSFGENENMASARGYFQTGDQVLSNIAVAKVVIKPSMMQGYGLIFGKVFYDRNGNNMHDNDEETFKNVELVTENGVRVTTDEYGKYSIPSVRLGSHVLKINPITLPKNTHVLLSSSDFLGDTDSRLVKLSASGIAKANFVLGGENFVPEKKVVTKAEKPKNNKQLPERSVVDIEQETMTRALRMTSYDPWSMKLVLEYNNDNNRYELSKSKELIDIKKYLNWRSDVTVLVEEAFKSNGFDVNMMHKSIKAEQQPVDVMCKELQGFGIEKRRIKCKYLKDLSRVEKNGRRIIKLTFFPVRVAPDEKQKINLQLDLNYTGSILLKDVKFYTYLPKGFILDETVSKLDFASYKPEIAGKNAIIWDMGDLKESKQHEMSFQLLPNETEEIGSHSSVVSMLEYHIGDGRLHQTPLMMNTISTEVNRLLFMEVIEDSDFEFHSPKLKSVEDEGIAKIAEFLRWQPWAKIRIEGYSDNVGSWKVGKVLSERRAEAVREVLIKKYLIQPSRIEMKGYGREYPIADNNTVEGREANRRVEIRVLSQKEQVQSNGDILFDDSIEITIEK